MTVGGGAAGACGRGGGVDAQHQVGKCLDPDNFDTALRELLADPGKQLHAIGSGDGQAAAVDPAVLAAAWHTAEAQRKQAAAKRRMAELDARLREERPNAERDWRKQVQQRKEADRKRAAAEAQAAAAAAAEEAELAKRPVPPPEDNTPMGLARRAWDAERRSREQARVKAAAAHQDRQQQWLDSDWGPALEQRRSELRAKRNGEEEHLSRQRNEVDAERRREAEAMGAEDAASAAFEAAATAECARREAQGPPLEDAAVAEAVKAILTHRGSELLAWQARAEEESQALEQQRLKEEERKEQEYREWREKVRVERCCQQRIRQREEVPGDHATADAIRKLELQGRDYFFERQQQNKATMEASFQQAGERTQQCRAAGSPRRALERARELAEQQRRIRDEKEPIKVEQELWDAMLTKNRMARRSEQGKSTPHSSTPREKRWGAL